MYDVNDLTISKHIVEVRIFLVRQIMESQFVSLNIVEFESSTSSVFPCQYKVQGNGRDDRDAIATTQLAAMRHTRSLRKHYLDQVFTVRSQLHLGRTIDLSENWSSWSWIVVDCVESAPVV